MHRKDYAVFSVACGVVALATFIFPSQVVGIFTRPFGASPSYVMYELHLGPALAADARSRLAHPLTESELQELKTDIHDCGKPGTQSLCATVEKYAMKGEVHAQLAMGVMLDSQYAAFDNSQKFPWLRVAFSQGGLPILQQALANIEKSNQLISGQANNQAIDLQDDRAKLLEAAMNNPNMSFEQMQALLHPNQGAYPVQPIAPPAYSSAASAPTIDINGNLNGSARQIPQMPIYSATAPNSPMPTYEAPPNPAPPTPSPTYLVQSRPTRILTPSGPQNYTDQDGTVYTGAGPHGLVNTQTGQFIPTN